MSRIRKWLRATSAPTLDIDRNERIEDFARQVVKCMRREGSFFSFHDTAIVLNIPLEDLVLVKERVYELTFEYVLEERQVTERQRAGLSWIAKTLRLDAEDAHRVELRAGRRVFDEYLAFSISGGHLTDEEIAEFRSLAAGLRVTTRQLLLLFLADSGDSFLKMVLEVLAERPQIEPAHWKRLTRSLAALGLGESELVRVLRAQAIRFEEEARSFQATASKKQDAERLRPTLKRLLAWLDRSAARHPA